MANPKKKTRTYLTDLGEEGHKLTERLKTRVIEGTQEWRDHQLLAGAGQCDDVEQWHTMVSRVR